MIAVNLFSVVDLLAVIISTHVLLVFAYRSLRVTRRSIDRLFTVVVGLVWVQSIFVLVSDNLVPTGVDAASVPNAPLVTLRLYQGMYVIGTLIMATLTHFAVRYAQCAHLPGRRVAWLYGGALALVPLYFSDGFLIGRDAPLQPTSGWRCAVPWQPESGPLSAVFIVLWLAANIYIQWLFRQRLRPVSPARAFDQHNYVWVGVTTWGVAGLVSMILAASGYAGVDPAMFMLAAAMVGLAIGLAEDHRHAEARNGFIKQVFGRYVTDDVVERLLESPRGLELGGERRVVSVMMSDLRGFTALAERLSPEQVVEMLNLYLGAMSEVIARHRGTINEFIGDGILAIFGAPIRRDDFAESAVRCALEMQLAMSAVNTQLAQLGIARIEMGIGINTGEVVIGNIGSAKRAKYGVVGSNVNLAARIESATIGGQVLVSQSTHAALAGVIETRAEIVLHPKGAREPLRVFDVVGLVGKSPLRLAVNEECWTTLREPLDVDCAVINEEKQATGRRFPAQVVALDASRAKLAWDDTVPAGANLRLRISVPPGFSGNGEFYAKVISVGPVGAPSVVWLTTPLSVAWAESVGAASRSGGDPVRPGLA